MPQQYYKGAIWTNHALQRLDQRGLTQEIAAQTFNNPDQSFSGRDKDSYQYVKQFGKSKVTIVAKQNEKSEWIILSCWIDPPMAGSEDDTRRKKYNAYQKSSFWGKIWVILKSQLGLSKY